MATVYVLSFLTLTVGGALIGFLVGYVAGRESVTPTDLANTMR